MQEYYPMVASLFDIFAIRWDKPWSLFSERRWDYILLRAGMLNKESPVFLTLKVVWSKERRWNSHKIVVVCGEEKAVGTVKEVDNDDAAQQSIVVTIIEFSTGVSCKGFQLVSIKKSLCRKMHASQLGGNNGPSNHKNKQTKKKNYFYYLQCPFTIC